MYIGVPQKSIIMFSGPTPSFTTDSPKSVTCAKKIIKIVKILLEGMFNEYGSVFEHTFIQKEGKIKQVPLRSFWAQVDLYGEVQEP